MIPTLTFYCTDPVTGLKQVCTGLTNANTPQLNGATCTQMVSEVNYVFTYVSAPNNVTLTEVQVNVLLATNKLEVGAAIVQKFSVSFKKAGAPTPYAKSGNPGYLLGAPLLGGTLSGTVSNAISYIPEPQLGITLVKEVVKSGSKTIQCPDTLTDYAIVFQSPMVKISFLVVPCI